MIMAGLARFAMNTSVVRGLAAAGVLVASAVQPVAAGDLVFHNGFDACWSKAITKTQFTGLMQSSIEGMTTCVAQSTGNCGPGCSYIACNTQACPGNAVGCPVTLHADAFGGTFVSGTSSFSAAGSADDINVPVSSTLATCTVTISSISLSYALDYTMQSDNGNGLYAASLDQSLVTVNAGYTASSENAICDLFAATLASGAVTTAESAAGALVESLEAPATVDETVCPAP
jgi:hypothetical protein